MGRYNVEGTTGTTTDCAKKYAGPLSIVGTVLGGAALMNSNSGCGSNNGGLLSGLFGCNNGDCYETKEAATLKAENAMLRSERYTDQVGLELYREQLGSDLELTRYFEGRLDRMADKQEALNAEFIRVLAAQDKDIALNKQAGEYQFLLTEKDINCLSKSVAKEFDCVDTAIATSEARTLCYVDGNFVKGELVMPLSKICPAAQPLCDASAAIAVRTVK